MQFFVFDMSNLIQHTISFISTSYFGTLYSTQGVNTHLQLAAMVIISPVDSTLYACMLFW